jgi:hypothetical protein
MRGPELHVTAKVINAKLTRCVRFLTEIVVGTRPANKQRRTNTRHLATTKLKAMSICYKSYSHWLEPITRSLDHKSHLNCNFRAWTASMMTGERPAKYRQEIQQASDFRIPVLPMLMRLIHRTQQMMFVGGETVDPSTEATWMVAKNCTGNRLSKWYAINPTRRDGKSDQVLAYKPPSWVNRRDSGFFSCCDFNCPSAITHLLPFARSFARVQHSRVDPEKSRIELWEMWMR